MNVTVPDRHAEIRSFLKDLRRRVDPTTRKLGDHERLDRRRGRAVTQEELAEAIGVSRGWYSLLENGAPIRPSVSMLDRVANALNASPHERGILFRLAVPALSGDLTFGTKEALQNLTLIRMVSARLWHASSENEALTIAGEYLVNWFQDASLIISAKRREVGSWEWWLAVDRGEGHRWSRCIAEMQRQLSPRQRDELADYPRMASPGAVSDHTALEQRNPQLRNATIRAYAKLDLKVTSFLQARVSTPANLIGCLHVKHMAGRSYSDMDHAVIGAIAELASLALS